MNKLFLLAHPFKRFRADFFSRFLKVPGRHMCPECRREFEDAPEAIEIAYYWDTEFEQPEESFDAGHLCFWGGFRMIVACECRDLLTQMDELFVFSEAKEIPCDEIPVFKHSRKDELAPYFWVRPRITLEVDRVENKIEICSSCNRFRDSPQQVTRIRIPKNSGANARCFSIKENRGFAMFVTEEFRLELESLDLKGIGFYPAGSLV
jgi:hypothetical protein